MAMLKVIGSTEKSVQAVVQDSTAPSKATGSQFKLNVRQAKLASLLFIFYRRLYAFGGQLLSAFTNVC